MLLLVSILMLTISILLIVEYVLVLFNVRGALEKISGPDAPRWRRYSPSTGCLIFGLVAVTALIYAISGL